MSGYIILTMRHTHPHTRKHIYKFTMARWPEPGKTSFPPGEHNFSCSAGDGAMHCQGTSPLSPLQIQPCVRYEPIVSQRTYVVIIITLKT